MVYYSSSDPNPVSPLAPAETVSRRLLKPGSHEVHASADALPNRQASAQAATGGVCFGSFLLVGEHKIPGGFCFNIACQMGMPPSRWEDMIIPSNLVFDGPQCLTGRESVLH